MSVYADFSSEEPFGQPAVYLEEDGVTPLHTAVLTNQLHQVKYHIKCLKKQNISLDIQTINGHTSLLLACKILSIDVNIAKVLIKAGANVNIGDNINITPLHAACANEKEEVAEVLLQAGASVNAEDTKWHATPLNYAVWARNSALVEMLLDARADANHRSVWISLLDYICEADDYDYYNETTVEKLLSLINDFNCTNDDGDTILMKAAKEGNKDLISLLIKYGADVNYNIKAIQNTVTYGHTEIFHMLWNVSNIEIFNSEEHTDLYYDLIEWSWNQNKPEQVECFYKVTNTPEVVLHPFIRYFHQLADLLTNPDSDDAVVINELFENKSDNVCKITKQLLARGAIFLDEDLEGLIYLCRKYHSYNYFDQEIKLLDLLVNYNVDISPHNRSYSGVHYLVTNIEN